MAKSISDMLDEYIAANGTDGVIDALVLKAGGADRAEGMLRRTRIAAVKEKYSKSIPAAVDLKVSNWDALEALATKPVVNQDGPANVFEMLLAGIDGAIEAKDAAALIEYLFLLWKAVKRG